MTRDETVRVWLLGGFKVSIGPHAIGGDAWHLKKAAALVKLLALAPGHRLHREQVMDLFWPDSGRKAASNNLRKTLHAARGTLDPAAGSRYVVSEDESLVLYPGGDLRVDAEAFEEAAAIGLRSREPAAYRVALELYAGDLLPEDRYEGWVEDKREELRRLYLDLLVELAQAYEQRSDLVRAIEALRMAEAQEPTLEEAHAGLMRLYALSGGEGKSISQYHTLRRILSERLGTEPSGATRRLHEDISTGRFSTIRIEHAAPSQEQDEPDVSKHNLPAPRSSFVGREQERIEIKRALAMTRLLTLTGPGGSGKTRLALEIARDLTGAYLDGVWLVELAGLSEGELVPHAVASALGIEEQPGQSLTQTLAEALRPKAILLVLDNCEHLMEDAANLADALLDCCPGLRILATSREPLRVQGETAWTVPPLSVPASGRPVTVEKLEGYEAARMFAERASDRRPGFALVPANAGAVAEICWRLEGLPLALELAAARVGTLTVDQISEKLENTLGILIGGTRTAGPRQQTLRGTLDWSHDLLSGPERKMFRRLSVFAGGWTLGAAEVVASGGDLEEAGTLNLLTELVEKSLVLAQTPAKGGARYRMLEPIRQYAREKLEGSGEAQTVKDAHAGHYLIFAERAEPELLGPREAEWVDRLEEEHDNFRAALSWSIEGHRPALGLRLAGALRSFWLEGHYGEGLGWLEETLAKEAETANARERVKALKAASVVARRQGNYARAEQVAEEALGVSAEPGVGDRQDVAFLTNMLGNIALHRGNLERATKLARKGLALSREVNDAECIADSLLLLGTIFRRRENYERAKGFFEEGVVLSRKSWGSALLLGIFLNDLGWTSLHEGDLAQANSLFEEAATLTREKRGEERFMAPFSLGWAALLGNDLKRAKALHTESLALCDKLGAEGFIPYVLETLGCVAVAESELKRAAILFGAAQTSRDTLGTSMALDFRRLVEPYVVEGRSQQETTIWEAAYAEGRLMGPEEAIKYALSERETDPSSDTMPGQASVGTQAATLTRREQEIAALAARGLTNRQIASELSISEHTAATHVRRVLKKLGLRSRSQVGSRLTERR